MPYTTLAALTERYGLDALVRLTDRAVPPAGVVDAAVLDRAIANADAEIDGYLAARYALPLADVPRLVAQLAEAMAFYHLHAYEPDEKTRRDYEQALRSLREIAAGAIRIPVAGADPAAQTGTGARATDRARDLTPENLRGFV